MTRLKEALKWWNKQTYNELWYHEIPERHRKALIKAKKIERVHLSTFRYKLKKDVG